jgi:threonine synthase
MAGLFCGGCGGKYSLDEPLWRCKCGSVLDIEFEATFPLKEIEGRAPTLWRYRESIPLAADGNIISMGEGLTPMIEEGVDGVSVWLKLEYMSPTGSFKDRGASVLVSKMRELGVKEAIEDSSGNAGCALAAYCAKARIDCHIFVPDRAPVEKVTQIGMYGARIERISGDREAVAAAALKAAERGYYASHSWNPFFLQGTKTIAFEICEQLNWSAPDTLILPIGNGTLLLGANSGFKDLVAGEIIERMPRLIGIQAEAYSPIFQMFKGGLEEIPAITGGDTIADGIAIAKPIRGRQIVRAILESKGDIFSVSEPQIRESLEMMGRLGYYIEPTSAVAIAGAKTYLKRASSGETVVIPLTGTGLKATRKIMDLGVG